MRGLIILSLCAALLALIVWWMPVNDNGVEPQPAAVAALPCGMPADRTSFGEIVVIGAGEGEIRAGLAVADRERVLGLSGVPCLPEDAGLLFDFGKAGFYPIWMKDMRFALDILWLGEDMSVVDIKEGILPQSFPDIFVNATPARFVLEIPAGSAEKLSIQKGTVLSF